MSDASASVPRLLPAPHSAESRACSSGAPTRGAAPLPAGRAVYRRTICTRSKEMKTASGVATAMPSASVILVASAAEPAGRCRPASGTPNSSASGSAVAVLVSGGQSGSRTAQPRSLTASRPSPPRCARLERPPKKLALPASRAQRTKRTPPPRRQSPSHRDTGDARSSKRVGMWRSRGQEPSGENLKASQKELRSRVFISYLTEPIRSLRQLKNIAQMTT